MFLDLSIQLSESCLWFNTAANSRFKTHVESVKHSLGLKKSKLPHDTKAYAPTSISKNGCDEEVEEVTPQTTKVIKEQ